MALRNILNRSLRHGSLHRVNPVRQFSSSLTPKPVYKPSLPFLSTPWLILPPDIKDGPNGPTDNYFNILDKTMVKIDRIKSHGNIPPNTKCIGSTQGWVAFNYDSDNSIFLAHPYKQGCSVKLPCYKYGIYRDGLHGTLAGNPGLNSGVEFALLALFRTNSEIYVGNSEGWQKEEEGEWSTEWLLAYNRKDNSVYKYQWCNKSGRLRISCWDVLRGNRIINTVELDDPFVDGHEQNKRNLSFFMHTEFKYPSDKAKVKYLVVGEEPGKSDPALFLVIRYVEKAEGVQCETKGIELIRIDLERGKVEYVTCLGDQALFLGTNTDPFFLSTSERPGLNSNSVYITDDLCVYDLETKCLTPFLSLGDLASIRPQVYWLEPRYFP